MGFRDKVSARAASLVQRSDLSSSGLVQNESKSRWEPVQVGEWLGFLINTIQHIFQVPEAKLAKLKCLLESLILDGFSTPRELARVALLLVFLRDRCIFPFSPGLHGMHRLFFPRPYCKN